MMHVQPPYLVINYMILLLNILNGLFCFNGNRKRKVPILITGLVLLIFNLVIYLHPVTAEIFENIPVSVLWFFFFYYYSEGNFFAKSAIFFGMFYTTLYLYVMVSFLAECFFPYESNGYFLILFTVTFVLYLTYGILSWRFGRLICDKLFSYVRTAEWAVYMTITVLILIILGYAYFSQGIIWHPIPLYTTPYFLLLPTAMFGCFALIITTILSTHEKAKYKYEAEISKGIVATGRDHYQRMDEMYGRLRVLRHDYKYHLNATRKMIQAGETQEAGEYLTDIEEQLSSYTLQNYCTNHVINALLAEYDLRCQRANIQFKVNINLPQSLSIPDYELCIVLGNLLENAVYACEKLPQERSIWLETQNTRNQLLFMVKNTFDGNISHKDGMPSSQKVGGGFGLCSVKEVISEHNGDVLFEWDSTCFTAYVAVKL